MTNKSKKNTNLKLISENRLIQTKVRMLTLKTFFLFTKFRKIKNLNYNKAICLCIQAKNKAKNFHQKNQNYKRKD